MSTTTQRETLARYDGWKASVRSARRCLRGEHGLRRQAGTPGLTFHKADGLVIRALIHREGRVKLATFTTCDGRTMLRCYTQGQLVWRGNDAPRNSAPDPEMAASL